MTLSRQIFVLLILVKGYMKENIEIKKVETLEECLICNKLLESLIKFESKLDDQINENHKIENHYEKTLGKDDCVIFVAYDENSIVGYIMAYKQKRNLVMKDNIINITQIYIDEKYRKQNIGKRLMNEVEKWARDSFEIFVIELDCISNNVNAIQFYKNLGYSPVRIKMRKNFK